MLRTENGDGRFVVGHDLEATAQDVVRNFLTSPGDCRHFLFDLGILSFCLRHWSEYVYHWPPGVCSAAAGLFQADMRRHRLRSWCWLGGYTCTGSALCLEGVSALTSAKAHCWSVPHTHDCLVLSSSWSGSLISARWGESLANWLAIPMNLCSLVMLRGAPSLGLQTSSQGLPKFPLDQRAAWGTSPLSGGIIIV